MGGAAARSAVGPNMAKASKRAFDSNTKLTIHKKCCPFQGLTRKFSKQFFDAKFMNINISSLSGTKGS